MYSLRHVRNLIFAGITLFTAALQAQNILVSLSPNRSAPALLDGQTVAGDIYVFTGPDTNVTKVDFYLNDPTFTGVPHQTERLVPFDFAGTIDENLTAIPYDTTALTDGQHVIGAVITMTDDSQITLNSTFTVANNQKALLFSTPHFNATVEEGDSAFTLTSELTASDAEAAAYELVSDADWLTAALPSGSTPENVVLTVDPAGLSAGSYSGTVSATADSYLNATVDVLLTVAAGYQLRVSARPDRADSQTLNGAIVAGDIYVFTAPDNNVSSVAFYLDDTAMVGVPFKTEGYAPFDFAGTALDDTAYPYDTVQLIDGNHSITVEMTLADASVVQKNALFTIANSSTLLANPSTMTLNATTGEVSQNVAVEVSASNGAAEDFDVTVDTDWLRISSTTATTPTNITVWADAAQLAAATYSGTVTFSSDTLGSATCTVDLVVAPADTQLSFSTSSLSFAGEPGQLLEAQQVQLQSGNGAVSASLSSNTGWLSVEPETGTTPFSFNVTADTSGMVAGIYNGKIIATTSEEIAELPVQLTLTSNEPSPFNILYSKNADRSGAAPLNGAVTSGPVYIFTYPDETVTQVRFFLDDPERLGQPFTVEGLLPFDFAGTAIGGNANPYNLDNLSDGQHYVSVEMVLEDDTVVNVDSVFTVDSEAPALYFNSGAIDLVLQQGEVTAATAGLAASDGSNMSFTTGSFFLKDESAWFNASGSSATLPSEIQLDIDSQNLLMGVYQGTLIASATGCTDALLPIHLDVVPAYGLYFSLNPDRSAAETLTDAEIAGDVYIFTAPDSDVASVIFYLDDPEMSGPPYIIENYAPFDFAGTAPENYAGPYDTRNLSDGIHEITAFFEFTDGSTQTVTSPFLVVNSPKLSVAPESLSFTIDAGNVSAPQQLVIETASGTVADVTLSNDSDWLQLSKSAGATPLTVDVTADAVNLNTGTFNDSIKVTAAGYAENVIPVEVHVINKALSFTAESISFTVRDQAETKTLELVANDGAEVGYSLIDDADWLTAEPDSGSTPESTFITVDPTGLPLGTFTATLIASADGYDDAVLTVELTVTDLQLVFDTPQIQKNLDENQAAQVVEVNLTASDDNEVTFSLSENANWISLEQNDYLTPAAVPITLDPSDLEPGVYTATVTASADSYVDAVLQVELTVHRRLLFSPSSLTVTTLQSETVHTETVTVASTSTGPVNFITSETADWLTIEPQSGTAPDELTLSFLPATMITGVHTATVTATAENHESASLQIEVTVNASVIASVTELQFEALDGSTPPDQSFDVVTSDGVETDFTAVVDAGWLSVTPDSGSTPAILNVAVNPTALEDGVHTATITVSAPDCAPAVIDIELVVGTPELLFSKTSVILNSDLTTPVTETAELSAKAGAEIDYQIFVDAEWLSVAPNPGRTPENITLTAEPAGLDPGTYTATVTASAGGYQNAVLNVQFQVSGKYQLVVATTTDRSFAVPLNNRTLADDIYIFITPEEDIAWVDFYLDDPNQNGEPAQTEKAASYDFAGTGSNNVPNPFDTTVLDDGDHEITAVITLTDSSTVTLNGSFALANLHTKVTATPAQFSFTVAEGYDAEIVSMNLETSDGSAQGFTITPFADWLNIDQEQGFTPSTVALNTASSLLPQGVYKSKLLIDMGESADLIIPVTLNVTPDYRLKLSSSRQRSNAVELQNSRVVDYIYVFIDALPGIQQIDFYLDDPNRSGTPFKIEKAAPWDFAGTAVDDTANPYDTNLLNDGAHEITAVIKMLDGSSPVVSSSFSVVNNSPRLTFSDETLYLYVGRGTTETFSVGLSMSDGSAVDYNISDSADWLSFDPVTGTTPKMLSMNVDADNLDLGSYAATATATASSITGAEAQLNIELTVTRASNIAADNFNDENNILDWTFVNESGPSASWSIRNQRLHQATGLSSTTGSVYTGTYAYHQDGFGWSDYELQVQAAVSDINNDAFGVMFRYQNNNNYYRFSMSRRQGWRRLEKKVNGVFQTLAFDGRPPQINEWVDIRIDVKGSNIFVYLNDNPILGASDSSLAYGTVALFTQGYSYFENLIVSHSPDEPKVALTKPVGFTVPVSHDAVTPYALDVTAIAANLPSGGGLGFILSDGMDEISKFDYSAPYTARFTGLAAGDYEVEAFVVDHTGLPIANDLGYDSNPGVGVGGFQIVALGNSLTSGFADNYSYDNDSLDGRNLNRGFTPVLNNFLSSEYGNPVTVYNEGMGGKTAEYTLNRLNETIVRHADSAYWLILIGTNDARMTSPPSSGLGLQSGDFGYDGSYKAMLQDMITQLLNAGIIPVPMKVPITFGLTHNSTPYPNPATAEVNLLIQEYNAAIDELVIENALPVAPPDFYSYFEQHPEEFIDNLHPTGFGYRSMAQLIINSFVNSGILE